MRTWGERITILCALLSALVTLGLASWLVLLVLAAEPGAYVVPPAVWCPGPVSGC